MMGIIIDKYAIGFIDDVLGIWEPDPDPFADSVKWQEFQDVMNSFHELEWEHSVRTSTVNFMDLTLSIDKNKITTNLYSKPLNRLNVVYFYYTTTVTTI